MHGLIAVTPFVEAARQIVFGLEFELSFSGSVTNVLRNGSALTWRHHGLGMLQAELTDTLRIHIWHPKLVSPGMAWPRCVHDHRFDIVSAVVIGAVIDWPHDVMQDGHRTPPEVGWVNTNVYEIEHAKNQDRMVKKGGCSTATSAKLLAHGAVRKRPKMAWTAGCEYGVERRRFHTTLVEDLAITVVHRSNFDDRLARVLCAPNSDVTAVSGIVRDESLEHKCLIAWVLGQAADAIANEEKGDT